MRSPLASFAALGHPEPPLAALTATAEPNHQGLTQPTASAAPATYPPSLAARAAHAALVASLCGRCGGALGLGLG